MFGSGPPLPKGVGSRYPLLTRVSNGGPTAISVQIFSKRKRCLVLGSNGLSGPKSRLMSSKWV